MRKLALALAGVVVAAGCSSTAGPHWRGSGERVVQVRINPSAQDGWVVQAVANTAAEWSDRVDRFRFVVAYGTCQPGEDCVDVQRAPGLAADTRIGWDSSGHMYGRAAVVTFDSAPWAWDPLLNAACHELGHVVGLDHSPIPGVAGPCQDGHPTTWDVQLANQQYAHDD